MKYCRNCSKEFPQKSEFCGSCGAVLDDRGYIEKIKTFDDETVMLEAELLYKDLKKHLGSTKKISIQKEGEITAAEVELTDEMVRGMSIIATKVKLHEKIYSTIISFVNDEREFKFSRYFSLRRIDTDGKSWLRIVTDEDKDYMMPQRDQYIARRLSRTPVYVFVVNKKIFIYFENKNPKYVLLGDNIVNSKVFEAIPLLTPVNIGIVVKISFKEETIIRTLEGHNLNKYLEEH